MRKVLKCLMSAFNSFSVIRILSVMRKYFSVNVYRVVAIKSCSLPSQPIEIKPHGLKRKLLPPSSCLYAQFRTLKLWTCKLYRHEEVTGWAQNDTSSCLCFKKTSNICRLLYCRTLYNQMIVNLLCAICTWLLQVHPILKKNRFTETKL